jgi:hypothetical protein
MTVRDLIKLLQKCDPDATVRGEDGEPLSRVESHPSSDFYTVTRRAPYWDEQPAIPPSHVVIA